VRLVGNAAERASVVSFVVENPPLSALDVGTQLDLEGIAVRTGHHCCQPVMDRFGIPATARASLAMYNTFEEADALATALERIVADAGGRSVAVPAASQKNEPVLFPPAVAASPQEAADELVDAFDFLEDWSQRYQYLIEAGSKLPPMPMAWKTEE